MPSFRPGQDTRFARDSSTSRRHSARLRWMVLIAFMSGPGLVLPVAKQPIITLVTFALTPAESADVALRACGKPYQLELQAAGGWSSDVENHDNMFVIARCQPHRRYRDLPVAYETHCSVENGATNCDPATEFIFTRLNGVAVTISSSEPEVSVEKAYQIYEFLQSRGALAGIEPQESFLHGVEPSIACRVRDHMEGTDWFICGQRYFTLDGSGPSDYVIGNAPADPTRQRGAISQQLLSRLDMQKRSRR